MGWKFLEERIALRRGGVGGRRAGGAGRKAWGELRSKGGLSASSSHLVKWKISMDIVLSFPSLS